MLLLVFICMSSMAFAEVKEYGPDFLHFTLDIPVNFKTETMDNGVKAISPDGNSALALQANKSNGATAEQIANAMGKQLGITDITKVDDELYTLGGTVEGVRTVCTVMVHEGKFLLLIMSGELKLLQPIVDSLKITKE